MRTLRQIGLALIESERTSAIAAKRYDRIKYVYGNCTIPCRCCDRKAGCLAEAAYQVYRSARMRRGQAIRSLRAMAMNEAD